MLLQVSDRLQYSYEYEYKSAVRTKPTEYVLRKGSNCYSYEYVVYVYER